MRAKEMLALGVRRTRHGMAYAPWNGLRAMEWPRERLAEFRRRLSAAELPETA